jgi:hypothetical protein
VIFNSCLHPIAYAVTPAGGEGEHTAARHMLIAKGTKRRCHCSFQCYNFSGSNNAKCVTCEPLAVQPSRGWEGGQTTSCGSSFQGRFRRCHGRRSIAASTVFLSPAGASRRHALSPRATLCRYCPPCALPHRPHVGPPLCDGDIHAP